MSIRDDEMVVCMQIRLSDDLFDRYYNHEEDRAESEPRLIELWKQDIDEFKQKCVMLGYSEEEITDIVRDILECGYYYLNNVKQE